MRRLDMVREGITVRLKDMRGITTRLTNIKKNHSTHGKHDNGNGGITLDPGKESVDN